MLYVKTIELRALKNAIINVKCVYSNFAPLINTKAIIPKNPFKAFITNDACISFP